MNQSDVAPDVGGKRPRLPALQGVRIVAALHIYLFHIKQTHDIGLLAYPAIASLPAPLALLMGRGHVSTGLFFLLSGFLLAYAYLDAEGRPKNSDGAFWKGRFLRLYPLYFFSLLPLIPAPALLPITAAHPTAPQIVGGIVTNLTLTQAWFPAFAIWWNAPAWALSAFAFFYLVFPAFARRTAGSSRRALIGWLGGLTAASWLPAGLYLLVDPEKNAWTATAVTLGGFWLNVLRFDPLVWLPQFLAGMTLGRLFALRVDGDPKSIDADLRPGPGDLAAAATLLLLAFVPAIPYVPLRHGLATPLLLVVLYDLARQRGLLARLLSGRTVGWFAEASFSIFALQMPVGVWVTIAFPAELRGTTLHLTAMIVATLLTAICWTQFIERRRTKGRSVEKPIKLGAPAPALPLPSA